jgi:hypothetical protein
MVTTTDGQATQTIGLFDDVIEVREARPAEANRLLAEGHWTLQGVYQWAALAEPKKPGEPPYVRKSVVYVLLRRR